jgi:hypothetical protein
MRTDDAEARLRELLADAGIDPEAPTASDVETVWDVIRHFAQEPAEDAAPREEHGDGILAQYGVYAWDSAPHFELDMTRQFTLLDEHGEYDHMTQLQCTFQFEVTDDLRAIGEENLWSFDLDRNEFFARARDLPGFRHVRETRLKPLRLVIVYDEL